MAKMNEQQAQVMSEIYARCNAAEYIAIAKPMQGMWYYYIAATTPANVRNAMSGIETCDEGLKARFRPSNGQFYRAAKAAKAEVMPLASVEFVDSEVVRIAAETGCRVNRGAAVECLIAKQVGANWAHNPIQAGFWMVPDVVAADGRTIQVKAYGGSVTEKDLHSAIAACK